MYQVVLALLAISGFEFQEVLGQGICSGIAVGYDTAAGPQYDVMVLLNTTTLEQCCGACQMVGVCQAFVYSPPEAKCYLKNATEPRIWTGNQLISGSPITPTWSFPPGCQALTQGLDISPGSNDIISFTNTSIDSCCSLCTANVQCKGWVFKFDTKECFLKSVKSPWTFAGPNLLSGLPTTGPSTVQAGQCIG